MPLPKGEQKREITTGSYACIAFVPLFRGTSKEFAEGVSSGHTCITAGEQGEPAVVLYERINLSVPVGGPTASGYATNYFNLSGRCGSSYGDR